MKKRGKGTHIHLSNRLSYTLIAILILAAIGVGVYALTPGVAPNPGHLISETAPPSSCTANQYLQFDGTNWKCATPPLNSLTKGIPAYTVMAYCSGAGAVSFSNKCSPAQIGTCTVGNYNIVCCTYYTCNGGTQILCPGPPAQCDNTQIAGYLVN